MIPGSSPYEPKNPQATESEKDAKIKKEMDAKLAEALKKVKEIQQKPRDLTPEEYERLQRMNGDL